MQRRSSPAASPPLCPDSESALAELMVERAEPLFVVGGGTRFIGSAQAPRQLSTAALRGIRLYEPGALTLVVAAGTPLADVEALLAEEGQHLAFEPPDFRPLLGRTGVSTIGGVLAANDSGPRRVHLGAARDFALGLRFVDGTGAVIKSGGRVMKNVTGYDLVKLLAGSRGTLGVITEVALKVLPKPEVEVTLLSEPLAPRAAVVAMSAALSSPFGVSGAARLVTGEVAVRIEGFRDSVAERKGMLLERLARHGLWQIREREESRALWRGIRDVLAFAERPGDVWRVSCRPSEAASLAERLEGEVVFDWGGARLWCLVPEGTDLRVRLGAFSGHATLVRAAEATLSRLAAFPPEAPRVAALSTALKRAFDPRGLFNQQLMIPSESLFHANSFYR